MEHLVSDGGALVAFFQVILIDLALAGDNAIVIGLAAAGLPKELRPKAIFIGIVAATILRIAFALIATELLEIIGLLLAGGVLLLWVCWKMYRELATSHRVDAIETITDQDIDRDGTIGEGAPQKTLRQATIQIVLADISMSLDNVLAAAGAAHAYPLVLAFGLALSVVLMGFAASFIAGLLHKHRWIAYLGLLIILYVALNMIWHGGHEVLHLLRHMPR